jgi:hypothetical protein
LILARSLHITPYNREVKFSTFGKKKIFTMQTTNPMNSLGQIRKASALFLSVVFVISINLQEAASQTIAIGHISAEVVESVSASSNMNLTFNLANVSNGTRTLQMSPSQMNTRRVEMGEVTLNSGRNIACNVMMKASTLSDNRGNQFTIEPTTSLNGRQDTNRADGSQNLHLTGNAMLEQNQANGLYQGSYTMIFAYN